MMKPLETVRPAAGVRRLAVALRSPICTFLLAGVMAVTLAGAPVTGRAAFEFPTGDATPPDQSNATTGAPPADPVPSEPAHACDVPPEIAPAQDEPLPQLVSAVKEAPKPMTIVVLGSQSGAGNPQVQDIPGFPPRLQSSLEADFAGRALDLPVKVETVGKMRALAGELAALIRQQVLPLKPSLVLWQVGRADARQANSPHRFAQSLKEGLDILQQAGIATILADIQFHPQFEALYRTDDYRNYVRWVAGKRDLPLLHRYEMIEHWATGGAIDLDSADDADQQAAFRFIQECLAYQATRMIVAASGLARQ